MVLARVRSCQSTESEGYTAGSESSSKPSEDGRKLQSLCLSTSWTWPLQKGAADLGYASRARSRLRWLFRGLCCLALVHLPLAAAPTSPTPTLRFAPTSLLFFLPIRHDIHYSWALEDSNSTDSLGGRGDAAPTADSQHRRAPRPDAAQSTWRDGAWYVSGLQLHSELVSTADTSASPWFSHVRLLFTSIWWPSRRPERPRDRDRYLVRACVCPTASQ